MIDISTIEYDAELLTESGARYNLNGALIELQWEERMSELAQRATLTLANLAMGNTWLMNLAKLNCMLFIYGRWGGLNGRTPLFEGQIWDWQYSSETNKKLMVTAYDRLIYLQQSKDHKYYPAGMSTQNIISDICGDWGVPVSYEWDKSETHEKKVFNGAAISDMIFELLEDTRQQSSEKYCAYWRGGKLLICGRGTNGTVYKFDTANTVSTSDRHTMNNLVTRVKVIGQQDDDSRAPVEATEDGDTSFGVLQEIVRRDKDKSLDAAKADARTMLKDRGQPERDTQIEFPDLPFLRKGDLVEIAAGNLLEAFYVEGVSHNGTSRKMRLTLERAAGA